MMTIKDLWLMTSFIDEIDSIDEILKEIKTIEYTEFPFSFSHGYDIERKVFNIVCKSRLASKLEKDNDGTIY